MRHVAPMGVKFGMEEGTEGPLLLAKFHPHRCNDKGVGPPKLKFLLRFCTSFQVALGVKIWLDLLKGYGVMGVLS